MAAPHLLVALSGHGYGHLAQTAEVVNALRRRLGGLRVTVHTVLAEAVVRARIAGDIACEPLAWDIGMLMASPLDVLAHESARAYRALHQDWEQRVADGARALLALRPDLVLANVPYLTLAAAAKAGIPALALCSLNWAEVYAHYCGHRPEADTVRAQMLDAYRSASIFLRPEPAMPMPALPTRLIGPVARRGANRRAEIDGRLRLTPGERLVLVAPGGVSGRLPVERWPVVSDVRWLVSQDWEARRPDVFALEALHMPFIDLLASSDMLLTKPGYGAFTEAACNGVPVLYAARRDWPEEPYLVEWLRRSGRCREVARARLDDGDFVTDLRALLGMPAVPVVEPTGTGEAAAILGAYLG